MVQILTIQQYMALALTMLTYCSCLLGMSLCFHHTQNAATELHKSSGEIFYANLMLLAVAALILLCTDNARQLLFAFVQ